MKGTLAGDPVRYEDCGHAKTAVTQLVAEWADVDWFVPPSAAAAELLARELFQEHHSTAHAREPALFAPRVNVRTGTGGWDEFRTLTARVSQSSTWDWKYAALKPLSKRHSDACGWAFERDAPGSLTVRPREDLVIWRAPSPELNFRKELPETEARLASWYLSYAAMDFLDSLVWQLAEKSSDRVGNPFVPLVRCYALGFYPFAITREEVVLASFRLDATTPRA